MTQPQPQNLFQHNRIENLVIHNNPDNDVAAESRTEPVGMKATFSEKEFLKKLAHAEGIDVSKLVRRALSLYIEFYRHFRKLLKYKLAVKALLDSLP